MTKTATRRKPAASRPRAAARPRTTTRRKPEPALTRARKAVASHLGRQADDVWGLGLVLVALVAAMGIYVDLAGPLGRLIGQASGGLFGLARFVVPPALAGVGVMLLRDRTRQEPGRVAIGMSVSAVAVVGLLHLFRSAELQPGELKGAGGLLGAVVGGPLRALLSPWGATLVLATMTAVGLLIVTKTSVRTAGERLGGVFTRLFAWFRGATTRPPLADELDAHHSPPGHRAPRPPLFA